MAKWQSKRWSSPDCWFFYRLMLQVEKHPGGGLCRVSNIGSLQFGGSGRDWMRWIKWLLWQKLQVVQPWNAWRECFSVLFFTLVMAALLVLRGSVSLVFNWFWLFVSLPRPVPELLVSLTWNNIVAGMMSLHILVGLQEQSLASVFFRLHWNAGTRNRSDPQRLVVLRSGPPMTCNTVSRRNVKTFQRHFRFALIIKHPISPVQRR